MATAALGAMAGGGGGGGMPQIKLPEKFAENVDFQGQGNVGCICCSSNSSLNQKNIRLIQNTNPDSDAPFAAKKAGPSLLKRIADKICCCCSSSQKQQVIENAEAIESLMEQLEEYNSSKKGKNFSKMVDLKARVGLEQKKANGDPLMLEDYAKVMQAAEELEKHTATLEKMIKQLEYYGMSRKVPASPKSDKPDIINYRYGKKVSKRVEKTNGRHESFKSQKLEKSIASDIPCPQISKKAMKGIVEHVKATIDAEQIDAISTKEIQKIIVQDLKTIGVKIQKPDFLDEIDDLTIKKKLRKKQRLSQFSCDEFEALYEIAQRRDFEIMEASTDEVFIKRTTKTRRKRRKKKHVELTASSKTPTRVKMRKRDKKEKQKI